MIHSNSDSSIKLLPYDKQILSDASSTEHNVDITGTTTSSINTDTHVALYDL